MNQSFRTKIIIAILLWTGSLANSQDTIHYIGIADNAIIYEELELYPDSTFKWSSVYDLAWSEYGLYEFMDDILWLEYYIVIDIPKSMTLKDSIQCISWPFKIETLIIEKDNLYRQTDSGRKVKRIFDRSFKTRWSWLFGHRYRIIKN